jgi:hypothetical protein
MKTTYLISAVAAGTLLFGAAGLSAKTFDYTTNGGVLASSAVDHGVGGFTPWYYQVWNLMPEDDFSWNFGTEYGGLGTINFPSHMGDVYPGYSWGGGTTDQGPFIKTDGLGRTYGKSGMGLWGVDDTVTDDGTEKVFGYLVHFNRDINPGGDIPFGMDTNVTWNLTLTDPDAGDAEAFTHDFDFLLYFWETRNRGEYPAGTAGTSCPNSHNELFHVDFGGGHIHDFNGTGDASDVPKNIDGLGCDDAFSFDTLTPQNQFEFDYGGRHYTLDITGFYEVDRETGACTSTSTFWSDENQTNVACVNFSLISEPLDFYGCTPGYWRQDQHEDSWTGYSPSDLFNTVFSAPGADGIAHPVDANPYEDYVNKKGKLGVDYNDVLTLGEAIWIKANTDGLTALIRHATAALLNAANPDVAYPYSEGEIIDLVQGAFLADPTTEAGMEIIKGAHDVLKDANEAELGCPLN